MSVARGFPNAGHFYSNIVKPIKIDCQFTVTPTNGLGITSLKSNGFIRNVFMHTSTTPASNNGYTNPNPASGYALVQFNNAFNAALGGFSGFVSPLTGGALTLTGSSLTIGLPYVITTVGTVPAAAFTVTTVADSSGSLAGKYFTLSDVFGNNYVVWFSVSGTGSAPALVGSLSGYTAVQQSIATNDTANTIATALRITIAALNGTASFSTGGSTDAVIITNAGPFNLTFKPLPNAQTSGMTVSAVTFTDLAHDWQHVGLPPGLTPTLNQSFIATATGGALGSGAVKLAGVSGINSVEVIGDPNQSISNSDLAANGGAWVLVQFLGATSSSVTTQLPTAPATGSVVNMSFFFDGSNVTVDGL